MNLMSKWKKKKVGFQPIAEDKPVALIGAPAPYKVPLYPFTCDLIVENLWQGDFPDVGFDPSKFDDVVSMTGESMPDFWPKVGGLWLYVPIWDGFEVDNPGGIRAAAQLVADRVKAGRRVLVHCAAGLNRSGIVSARALMFMGMDVTEAIATVRNRRYGALCNPTFVEWLYKEAGRPMPDAEKPRYLASMFRPGSRLEDDEDDSLWLSIILAAEKAAQKGSVENSEQPSSGAAVEVDLECSAREPVSPVAADNL